MTKEERHKEIGKVSPFSNLKILDSLFYVNGIGHFDKKLASKIKQINKYDCKIVKYPYGILFKVSSWKYGVSFQKIIELYLQDFSFNERILKIVTIENEIIFKINKNKITTLKPFFNQQIGISITDQTSLYNYDFGGINKTNSSQGKIFTVFFIIILGGIAYFYYKYFTDSSFRESFGVWLFLTIIGIIISIIVAINKIKK